MPVRVFRAATMQEALEQIRQEMGSEASVLSTRHVRDGWMGWLGSACVEVTAGVGVQGSEPNDVNEHLSQASVNRIADSRNLNPTIESQVDRLSVTRALLSQPVSHRTLPSPLLSLRDRLLDVGVSETIIQRWLQATNSFAIGLGETLEQPWLEHLHRSIARELRLGGPIRIPAGSRHVVALVGPTGVGKTTTIAKLAAGFSLDAKRRVGLLTIDTFRIAAVQQLKSYAQIMDLPMQVVERPEQMSAALDELGDVDLVLIDTAGRSPDSHEMIDQLVELLCSAQPDETHLVLSANHAPASISAELQGFSRARPTALILTKMDETPYTASVLSGITGPERWANIPISYVTNGQQVPDDISVATAEMLVQRLLPNSMVLPEAKAA